MKVRKKPCRHCLFTKNASVDLSNLAEERSRALLLRIPFKCHEHSEAIVCNGYFKRCPDMVPNPERINYNGNLKHKFSNMTRKQMNEYVVAS